MEQPARPTRQPDQAPARSGMPLQRSAENRVISGVCGGLAEHTDIDPIIYRVLTVVLALVGGAGLVLYGAAVLLLPDARTGTAPLGRLVAGSRQRGMRTAWVLLAIIGLLVVAGGLAGVFGGGSLSIVVIAGLAVLVAHRRGVTFRDLVRDGDGQAASAASDDGGGPAVAGGAPAPESVPQPAPHVEAPQPTLATAQFTPRAFAPGPGPSTQQYVDFATLPPRPPAGQDTERPKRRSISMVVWLLACAVGGLFAWLQHDGQIIGDMRIPLIGALATLGLGLVVSAWVGRARVQFWGILLVLALGAVTFVTGPAAQVEWAPVSWRPTSAAQLSAQQPYAMGMGTGTLDLGRLPLERGRTYQAAAKVDTGQLVVLVPDTARVNLAVSCARCSIQAFGRELGGNRVSVQRDYPPREDRAPGRPGAKAPLLDLELAVETGVVEVRRAP